jgi:hypothetical protein
MKFSYDELYGRLEAAEGGRGVVPSDADAAESDWSTISLACNNSAISVYSLFSERLVRHLGVLSPPTSSRSRCLHQNAGFCPHLLALVLYSMILQ